MRILRMGFATADINSSGAISHEDFRLVVNSMHHGHLDEKEK